MNVQKYLVQQFCFMVFRLSFYLFATAVTFILIFGNPTLIKQAFIRTHAYDRFVPAVISSQLHSGQSTGSLPLHDPTVQKIIEESFPASTLQRGTETVINSFYDWLNGKTTQPDFTVDFTPNANQMATNLSNYAMSRLKSQPVCKAEPPEIDPFTASCRPEFFDYELSQQELANAIKANNGILGKTKYTINDLPKMTTGKTLVQQYSYAPRVFMLLNYAPGILVGITALSALCIIMLERKKRDAVHWIGVNIVSSSIFIVLSPLFYMYVFPHLFAGFTTGETGGATTVLNDVLTKITSDFNNELIFVGVLLVLIGLAIVMLERATRPQSKYRKIRKKAGLMSSEAPRNNKGKLRLRQTDVPIQTSEGPRLTEKYQKDKRYRTIHSKEY